ncbi:MAG: sigma-70 family RNA polymerase sigma factor [Pseudomonadota bacterium]
MSVNYDRIYRDHHGWLKNWLRQSTHCSEQAAELAHDTFVRLLTRRYQELEEPPRAMLRRVSRNLLIDHWRRQEVERAWLASVEHLPESEYPSPESRLLVIEAVLQIESVLARLPVQTQRIFALSQFEGMKQQAIADQLGISINTVRRHIQKALTACILAG